MSDAVNKALDEVSITLEFVLKDVNVLLNALNAPFSTPTIVNASFINAIQQQAGPQVEKARAGLEAALNKEQNNESTPAA
jgi:hypothetical protein